MYYQTDIEKKERRRIILITIAAAALILILLIAIIVVAANKSSKKDDVATQTNSAFEYKEEDKTEEKKEEKTETEKKEDKTVISTDTAPVANVVSDDMPNTGPEEILPLAIMLGLGAAYVSSYVISKKNA